MNNQYHLPEGTLIDTEENARALTGPDNLKNSLITKRLVEGMVVSCSKNHDLSVDMNGIPGVIPRDETAVGVAEGVTRDIAIISRVGKPVACIITAIEKDESGCVRLVLSRRLAQLESLEQYVQKLRPGDIIPCEITRVERFGVFVDIGRGLNSFISLENISVSRIPCPSEQFLSGERIFAVVTHVDEQNRICLSHKELLGTWEENAESYAIGQTVVGIVRGIENYGIFVELAPNLSGLAEPCEGYKPGDPVSVYIKNILPASMKIKLVIIDKAIASKPPRRYFITSGHIGKWEYSPSACVYKQIVRVFDAE